MNCRRVKEVIFLYTDNEMEGDLLISFRRHIEVCPGCARQIEHAMRLLTLMRKKCGRASAPERLRHRILTSFPHRQDWGEP